MKTKLITILTICLAIITTSCSDELETTTTAIDTTDAVSALNTLSESYATTQVTTKAIPEWLKKILIVACADISASLQADTGDADWYTVVIAGASASLSQGLTLSVSPNGNGTNVNGIDSNETNAYDKVGKWHYSAIENAYQKPAYYAVDGKYDNPTFYKHSVDFLSANKVATVEDFERFPVAVANEELATALAAYTTYGFYGSLEQLYRNKQIDATTFELLAPYYESLEKTRDINDFVAYSIEAETIVAEARLERATKKAILSTMATARYGMQYWRQVIK